MTRGRPRLGQNFLVDANVARAIVEWADIDGRTVVEVGPGRGALTELLRDRAQRLILVELDARLAEHWRERFAGDSLVDVVEGDALAVAFDELAGGPFSLVANLPYESGTAIVSRLLESARNVDAMVVMLQKEVCRRLLAGPGDRSYGLLSVHTALRADVVAGRAVPPSCFRPQPKVDSQVLRITPLGALRHAVGEPAIFAALVKAAFGERRKMLRNTLGPWLAERLGADEVGRAFEAAAIDPQSRPEEVSVRAFAMLSAYTVARG